ncbi:hypothetical protein C8R44DRAFT_742817 [Mycena epipterygia]|nr:hypothetical protein C8R44DRAFT_742817 [Mycena epipterygia]
MTQLDSASSVSKSISITKSSHFGIEEAGVETGIEGGELTGAEGRTVWLNIEPSSEGVRWCISTMKIWGASKGTPELVTTHGTGEIFKVLVMSLQGGKLGGQPNVQSHLECQGISTELRDVLQARREAEDNLNSAQACSKETVSGPRKLSHRVFHTLLVCAYKKVARSQVFCDLADARFGYPLGVSGARVFPRTSLRGRVISTD